MTTDKAALQPEKTSDLFSNQPHKFSKLFNLVSLSTDFSPPICAKLLFSNFVFRCFFHWAQRCSWGAISRVSNLRPCCKVLCFLFPFQCLLRLKPRLSVERQSDNSVLSNVYTALFNQVEDEAISLVHHQIYEIISKKWVSFCCLFF